MFRIKGLTKKTIKRLSSIEEVIFILDEFNFVAKSGLKTTQKAILIIHTYYNYWVSVFNSVFEFCDIKFCKNYKLFGVLFVQFC